jgi:TRAP-type C4-dicarboxylate transport system permease large subunit
MQSHRVFLSWMPGGLALVALVACALFTAFTGASGVTIVALGALLYPALVIMVPLILPVAISYGINPIHLGIIFLANMQIGYFTPPVGMNLFIASYRFEKPVAEIYAATIPFMIVLLISVILITYWPYLSMVLLR